MRPCSSKIFDVHLMIAPVDPYLEAFAEAGADIITIHPEAGPHIHRSIQAVKALGIKAGVVLNPGTPAKMLEYLIEEVDLVLVDGPVSPVQQRNLERRWNVKVVSGLPSVDKAFPRAEHWLRMAKAVGRNPKRCLAIVSSMSTTKTALAAMMHAVVVTDEFTEYQDFCGANLVCSDLKEVKPDAFFEEISF